MSTILEKVIEGDVRTVARLIRDIDDGVKGTEEILKSLYAHTGHAYVIGVTGPPGVGKSTLVDQMITLLREKDKTVGVLAVDPTSPFSGGAILGDRIRMQHHSLDQGVFIRSLANRGRFGGLTHSTRNAIKVLDVMGKDYIVVETVGVGQIEMDIVKHAHTTVVVVNPGMGDGIQAIKAGIFEVGDIFVINKAHDERAEKTYNELQQMIAMRDMNNKTWTPSIIKTEALLNVGMDKLWFEIEKHAAFLSEIKNNYAIQEKREQVIDDLYEIIKDKLFTHVLSNIYHSKAFDDAVASILDGKLDPYTAGERLLSSKLRKSEF